MNNDLTIDLFNKLNEIFHYRLPRGCQSLTLSLGIDIPPTITTKSIYFGEEFENREERPEIVTQKFGLIEYKDE